MFPLCQFYSLDKSFNVHSNDSRLNLDHRNSRSFRGQSAAINRQIHRLILTLKSNSWCCYVADCRHMGNIRSLTRSFSLSFSFPLFTYGFLCGKWRNSGRCIWCLRWGISIWKWLSLECRSRRRIENYSEFTSWFLWMFHLEFRCSHY